MPWSSLSRYLRFDVERDEGSATVRLAGELDLASVPVAHVALERAGSDSTQVVVDLSRVTLIDASGVRFLISAQHRARAAERRLIVARPNHAVRRVLELTGALPLLEVREAERADHWHPSAWDVAAILDAAIETAMRIGHADMSNAQLLDSTTGALRIVAQRGFTSPFLDFFEIVDDNESACGTALNRSKAVWVSDITRSPIFADTPGLDVVLDAGARAVASLPVKSAGGEPIAMISIHHVRPTDWPVQQRLALGQLARSTGELCLKVMGAHP